MKPAIEQKWPETEAEALSIQIELSKLLKLTSDYSRIEKIAGVDVAYNLSNDKLIAAVVVLDANSLEVIDQATVESKTKFPYIPGLFSFRELPPVVEAMTKLSIEPDLVICDGHGIAHPRGFGLACHLGVLFDIPTVGCAKTQLIGKSKTPESLRGSSSPVLLDSEVVGKSLRTQTNIKPVFISIGNRIGLEEACDWVLKAAPNYRLPETTRQADHLVNKMLKSKP